MEIDKKSPEARTFIIKMMDVLENVCIQNAIDLISRASANAKRDYSNLYCVCMYVECMSRIAR